LKKIFWLALHFLRYQWRERLLLTLILSIFIGVGTLSAVNFFASSVKLAMDARTSALLGADWLVESSQPLPMNDWSARAAQLGLETGQTVEFLSMIARKDNLQLASVKAVNAGYPVRGQLQVRDTLTSADYFIDNIPAEGEVWVAARLMPALHIAVGDVIEIGAAQFKVAKVLIQEPDTGLAFLAMAPRVLMNMADLPKTQVLDLGSRVEYRFLVGGQHDAITLFADEITPTLHAQEKVVNNMTSRPEVVQPVDSLLHFLTLTGLVIFMLSALAMALATRTYAEKQTDTTAILRCLGAQRRDMLIVYLSGLLILSLSISLLACLFGYGAAVAVMKLAIHWWEFVLPMPAIKPTVILALATGIILVLGFAWPWLLNLQNVSPLRVLQRQLSAPAASTYWVYGSMIVAFCLLWSIYQTPVLTAWMVLSVLMVLGCFAIMTYALLRWVAYLGKHIKMPWRLGLLQVTYDKRSSLMQIWVFAFVLTLIFFFMLVRQDFLHTWKNKLTKHAPNYFVINILTNQVNDIEHFFAAQAQRVPEFYPMVRARLTAMNDKPVSLEDYPAGNAPNMLRRDLNLSYSDTLDNKTIVSGEPWDLSAHDKALLSVEEKMAQELNLSIGDTITFEAGQTSFIGKIANIRHVDWYSMQPNFYVITTPGLLLDFPRTYLGSFYLPKSDEAFLNQLAAQFPNLTVIDVDAILSSMQDLITQALVVVEVLFFMVCIAALLVLIVIQRTASDTRAYISAVLRTLGASKDQLMRGWLSEFAILGFLAASIAIILAQILSMMVSHYILALTPEINWLALLLAPLVGMVIYVILGLVTLRRLMKKPPVLRLAGE
jgi:putative ABC transport system permease protein